MSGLLLEVDDPAAWYQALVEARSHGMLAATEIVPAASTLLLAGIEDIGRALRAIEGITPGGTQRQESEVEIPIHWDGEDLEEVASAWQQRPEETLKAAPLKVAFCGFAPGFAYLTGLAEHLELPRRATPRTRVRAGSLATAGPYVGIYPRATPGGWHLLGHTETILFDPAEDEPALLTPGTSVRLTDA